MVHFHMGAGEATPIIVLYIVANCSHVTHAVISLSFTHSDKGGVSGRGDFAYGPGYGMGGGGGGGFGGYGPPGRGECSRERV